MLRRRFIENLKQQQWTAAGIELVIVVLGVFIGLQVSNWNQDRISDQQAAGFAERLKADLREEDWAYQLLIAYNREVLASADLAADALEGEQTIADEALLVSAYRATQYRQRLRRRCHLRRADLDRHDRPHPGPDFARHRDAALQPPDDRQPRPRGNVVALSRGLPDDSPEQVQRALAKNCGDRYIETGNYAAITGVLDYPCSSGQSEQDTAKAADDLRSAPNLLPLLRLRIADLETRLVDLTANNRPILDRLRAIAAEKP